jgi:hypothetical protein
VACSSRLDAATLVGSLDACWLVVEPISLSIEVSEDGWYVVSDNIFCVYGDGDSLEAAWRDYRVALIEYCEMTREDANRDRESSIQYQQLQQYVRPCEHE